MGSFQNLQHKHSQYQHNIFVRGTEWRLIYRIIICSMAILIVAAIYFGHPFVQKLCAIRMIVQNSLSILLHPLPTLWYKAFL